MLECVDVNIKKNNQKHYSEALKNMLAVNVLLSSYFHSGYLPNIPNRIG